MPAGTRDQEELRQSRADIAIAMLLGAAERGDFSYQAEITQRLRGQVQVRLMDAGDKLVLAIIGPPEFLAIPAATLLEEARIDPLRRAFVGRVLRAMAGVTATLDTAALQEAVSAPTDLSALLRALQVAVPPTDAGGQSNALEHARLRGAAARARLIEVEGGTLSSAEVAKHLGLTRQAVDNRRKQGRLLGIQAGRRGYRYPVWQFVPEGTLPGLEEVLTELRDLGPWTQLAFMLNPKDSLVGQSPLEALREGRRGAAVEAARRYGEQGP